MQIVKVEWVDSSVDSGWHNKKHPGEAIGVSHCESVGFLLQKSRKEIVICLSQSKWSVGDIMTIPRSCVKKITRLKE